MADGLYVKVGNSVEPVTLEANTAPEYVERIEAVEEAVPALNSSLRSLIAQEAAKCLKLSGGVLTGPLEIQSLTKLKSTNVAVGSGQESWGGGGLALVDATGSRVGVIQPYFLADGRVKLCFFAEASGRSHGLEMFSDGSAFLGGNPVLTSAGGTLTGALRIAYGSQIQHDVDNADLTIYGGAGFQHGAQLTLIGKDASWLPGGFRLAARNAEKAVWLQGDIAGNLTWGGNAVYTAANGQVMNSNTVAVGNVTGNTFTLPAGGTWAYTYHRNTSSENFGGSGIAAGETTITADKGPTSYFAIRIA